MNRHLLTAAFLTVCLCFLSAANLSAQETGADTSDIIANDFRIINLGTIVNTGDLEYAPTITADGRTLYFVSDRQGGVGGHDFWYTTKKDRLDSVFAAPVNLGPPVNTELNEGVASISADGQVIYFTACTRDDGLGNCDIYEAELDGTEWTNVRNLREINSPYWDSQPSISSDGRTLYFVSDRPGGLGNVDIYITRLGSDGKWSEPANLGPPINTEEREDSPFIFPGGKLLFFSSSGHGGLGGLDFFASKLQEDRSWGAPQNLGEPFNTSNDERFLTLPAAGDVIYFSSERTDLGNEGKLDIFMGLLPPRTTNVLIAGRVFDVCTDNNLPANLVFIHEEEGDTLQVAETNTATGEFSFVVAAEGAMTVKVVGNVAQYGAISGTIKIPETKEYMEIRKDFPLGETPTLAATYEIADYIKALREENERRPANRKISSKFTDFRGLLIEENLVKELYPLLTYVFFDSGSATIPNRYVLFSNPNQTQGFSDSTIPGGTLQKYYHMLNVVGYRMRSHPETKITIQGHDSQEPGIGENPETSKQRAQVIYDYLTNIWQIDAGRIKMLKHGGFPRYRSNPRDPLGIVENRRVEILSDDWEIMKPILNTELRRYPQPDTMHFQMKNGIKDDLVARRAIEIKRNGQMWHVMGDVGTDEPVSPAYNWGKNGNEEEIPSNETPYTAQLVVYSKDGKECRSNEIQIPVMIVDNELKRRERLVDSTIDRYSLVLFTFDSDEAGPLNERILKEYIYDDIRQGAKINVTGYTDVVGAEDRNLTLSKQRSKTVENGIKRNVKSSIYNSLYGTGVGEESPLYSNDLPEGRFYNRTVQVVVKTPTGSDEGWEGQP